MRFESRPMPIGLLILVSLLVSLPLEAGASGLGIPTKQAGLGFGNLREFTGVRFNLVDKDVHYMGGLNFTFWIPKKNRRRSTREFPWAWSAMRPA